MTAAGAPVIALLATLLVAPFQLPTEDVNARMERFNRSLGVQCTHCHIEEKWTDESKPQFAIARNMSTMVPVLNDRLGMPDRVSCWTCHRGEVRPSRQPRPALDVELAKWPAELADRPESQKVTMAVYNVALGVGCDHCHGADWKAADKSAMKKVPTMNGLFEVFPKFMPPSARTQCFMCHKGSTKPAARITSG